VVKREGKGCCNLTYTNSFSLKRTFLIIFANMWWVFLMKQTNKKKKKNLQKLKKKIFFL